MFVMTRQEMTNERCAYVKHVWDAVQLTNISLSHSYQTLTLSSPSDSVGHAQFYLYCAFSCKPLCRLNVFLSCLRGQATARRVQPLMAG
jgi:hypothetical protein